MDGQPFYDRDEGVDRSTLRTKVGEKYLTYFVKVYLLSSTMIDKVLQVAHNIWPRIIASKDIVRHLGETKRRRGGNPNLKDMELTRCGVLGKERKHVGIDRVNGVENGLGA